MVRWLEEWIIMLNSASAEAGSGLSLAIFAVSVEFVTKYGIYSNIFVTQLSWTNLKKFYKFYKTIKVVELYSRRVW